MPPQQVGRFFAAWQVPEPPRRELSQDEFADMVGCSRPVVNRQLKQLERESIIRTTYSHFVILDVNALQSIVAQPH
jgi:DNA-binding transcriptional regulator LsrR (DeoR family)